MSVACFGGRAAGMAYLLSICLIEANRVVADAAITWLKADENDESAREVWRDNSQGDLKSCSACWPSTLEVRRRSVQPVVLCASQQRGMITTGYNFVGNASWIFQRGSAGWCRYVAHWLAAMVASTSHGFSPKDRFCRPWPACHALLPNDGTREKLDPSPLHKELARRPS